MRRAFCFIACALPLALLTTGCSQSTPEQAAVPGAPVVYENARVIDVDGPDGAAAIENASFLVANGEFQAVGAPGSFNIPEGAAHVDLAGKTVMPALVDAHAHPGWTLLKTDSTSADTYSKENLTDHLRRMAFYGIAAVQSMGIDPGEAVYELRANPVPGAALIRFAGRGMAMPNAGPGREYWRPVAYGVATEAEARAAVQELASKNVNLVKIWVDDRNHTVPKLKPELYRAIIDEAHKNGLRVAAHIFYLADAKDLLKAGIDGFAHGVRDIDIDDEFLTLIKTHPNVWVIPNLPDRGTSESDLMLAAESLPASRIAAMKANPAKPDMNLYSVQARNLKKITDAGVTIGFGTDSSSAIGWPAHQELADMVNAGMTPAQVLTAATKTAAQIVKLEKLGSIAPGKSASFIVLDANPLDNIENTRKISQVFLNGESLDRNAMQSDFVAEPK